MKDGENYDDWTYRYSVLPAIFMPRWASRITLEVTEVRVQRLQEISEEDAIAEGISKEYCDPIGKHSKADWHIRNDYRDLWNSINSKRGYSWDSNPWVWCISFKVIKPQISEVK